MLDTTQLSHVKTSKMLKLSSKGNECSGPAIWHGTKSELPFLNSLKMKMSIIMGVTQMMLGIFMSLLNFLAGPFTPPLLRGQLPSTFRNWRFECASTYSGTYNRHPTDRLFDPS
jgi:hypothetical protein